MLTKKVARRRARWIKRAVDLHHAALETLPAGPERDAAEASFAKLHALLNGSAKALAEFFDDDISTFSGGTDRPDGEELAADPDFADLDDED